MRSRHILELHTPRGLLWSLLLAGLLIRLLIMPFTTHSDLLGMYWMGSLVAYRGHFAFGLQSLLYYLHGVYLWFVTGLLPPIETLWLEQPSGASLDPYMFTDGWFHFIRHHQVYRTLFLLKLPYLLFDVACAYLVYRIVGNKILCVWWLNPILLFAVYVFGRHEIITLFFVLLSIYLARQEKWVRSLAALGIAIAIRYYALILLPFWVLSLPPRWKRRFWGTLIGLFPWFMINIISWSISGSYEVTNLFRLQHSNYLLAVRLQVAPWDNLYVFPLIYFLLLLHRVYNRVYDWCSACKYSLIATLFLLAASYTGQSPQYWTWFLPWLIVAMTEDRRLITLHIMQTVCLVVYGFVGGRETAGYLFAPLAPDFFWSLPSPIEIIGRFISPEIVISLAHTAFSAVTLWMAYLVVQQLRAARAHG